VNIDSDHYLLGSKIRVRISNIRKSKGPRLNKFNLGSPKSETVLKTFREDLHNRLNKMNLTDLTVNERWEQCRKVIIDSSEEILGVRSFRGADCGTDHYLVAAKLRERLSVMKQVAPKFDMQRFDLRKLNDAEVKEQYQVKITNRFAALEN
jgi:hypothetical protein